jgi:hypothetical protein
VLKFQFASRLATETRQLCWPPYFFLQVSA